MVETRPRRREAARSGSDLLGSGGVQQPAPIRHRGGLDARATRYSSHPCDPSALRHRAALPLRLWIVGSRRCHSARGARTDEGHQADIGAASQQGKWPSIQVLTIFVLRKRKASRQAELALPLRCKGKAHTRMREDSCGVWQLIDGRDMCASRTAVTAGSAIVAEPSFRALP